MKIVVPEVQISSDCGFSPDIDIFKRKGFGERLANLVENSGGSPVIALDSGWGEGKSTFIKMWRGYLENHREPEIISIYFDAFENDYQKDPFLTLASEIYQLITVEDEERKTKFKDKAAKAAKSLLRGALKVSVKVGTAGIVDGSAVDVAEKELSNLVADQVDDLIKERFEHAAKDKLALKEFRSYLSNFANEVNGGKPIVFIIDELDRCKPDFALELLEQVKHLFSVQGITFLLVTNREQLEESIKSKYGQGIDPTNYLHKFINVWLTMPRASDEYNDNGYQFLQNALSAMKEENDVIANTDSVSVLNDIVKFYQPSFREIERILSYFSIVNNMLGNQRYLENYQYMISMVCYLKACQPNCLKVINGKLNSSHIIEAARLDEIASSESYNLQYVNKLVRFDFADEDTRKQMLEEREIQMNGMRGAPQNLLKTISSWLSEINPS
ncbi:KAP family P-loop NTPase fold protein [Photobacterium andalusiense]|uniref:KAP family P-loop domain protein n=1 Tax=Photobacterium andalusiense TaxID=2204296 RepID=A0A1Y6MEN9_9GAMM|nr:P-loop NTPase fold protein [Photobacterium andalusiense]SMY35006.1 KAP family P-loop domain protein [Photobacterium andalusiense]